MASYPKLGFISFLLIISFFSIQTHARDSQFFSKFTRNGDIATTTTSTTPNTEYNPNNNEKEFVHLKKQQPDEQPVFIPQTTETGYGLYGHETGLDPPSTTLYNMDDINNNNNNNENLYNNENFNTNNNNNEYHEKNYATELQGLSSTSYTNNNNNNKHYESFNNNNDNNYENYNNNNNYENYNNNNNNYENYNNNNNDDNNYENYNNNKKGESKFYGGAGYNGVQEKQGMSDTRFMNNGKYFYDLEAENRNNYNPNNNNYNNNYNSNGYYGNKMNNFEEFYSNNNNKFYNGNGYQNQFPEEEEFDFDQP